MFASKTRARCAIAFHAWLIAVIFFNALAPITVAASSLSEKDQPKTDTVKIDNASVEDVPAYQEEADGQTQTLPQELRDLALPAETPVPAATAAAEEAVSKGPVLSLSADPDSIKAGGKLLLTWAIEGIVLEEHKLLSLQITLPDGFSLDGKYDGTYDEATRTLTISIATALSGPVNLLTNDSVTDSKMQAFLMEDTEILSEAGLFLPVHEQFVLDQQGGVIGVDEGQIKIEFPENVLSEQTMIEVGAPSGDAVPLYSLL